uniref:Uncharacterized protein n=1 Tax=Pyramimonas orientalis virus TaxID=455367 RepID=A0A7M3UPF6_POV01|nr:hypothetical protein HWQ62_00514 [Pyramimonas orientalis virus]
MCSNTFPKLTVYIPKQKKFIDTKPIIDFNILHADDEDYFVPYNTPVVSLKRNKRYHASDFKPYTTLKEFIVFYSEDN